MSERIAGAPARGLVRRLIYFLARRRVGRVPMPVQIHAHHGQLLIGMGSFEDALRRSRRVDGRLKALAQLRAASLVGCPF
jgi:hypothetical protein